MRKLDITYGGFGNWKAKIPPRQTPAGKPWDSVLKEVKESPTPCGNRDGGALEQAASLQVIERSPMASVEGRLALRIPARRFIPWAWIRPEIGANCTYLWSERPERARHAMEPRAGWWMQFSLITRLTAANFSGLGRSKGQGTIFLT
jgi:hypothetical protein